ncbi:COG4315 family predicted lipoprotein [Spartinivicinus poritis]|uniref:Lipoprotein n=1 Tax=Spartinivicinus poritis TaxID=2994640 RepID=A0ABT5UC72_9GAMM|nr:hypothetical protein [Spartinivicinus sp. A2-2]MDE1462704.1 hypothetical protein [Spartinivicinus sp. A2-2]
MHKLRLTAAALFIATTAACANAGHGPAQKQNGILVGDNGMTLYTFDKDVANSGKSVCNGKCAVNWPPLYADKAAKPSGDFSIVTRDDGSKQWAIKGKPLYFWIKDQKPGDTTGDGFKNVWHVVQ